MIALYLYVYSILDPTCYCLTIISEHIKEWLSRCAQKVFLEYNSSDMLIIKSNDIYNWNIVECGVKHHKSNHNQKIGKKYNPKLFGSK